MLLLLARGLAEVPQLIVNCIEGSSEGISEALLWLWIFSDILDVVGCTISDTVCVQWRGVCVLSAMLQAALAPPPL